MSMKSALHQLEQIADLMRNADVATRTNGYYSATPLIQQLMDATDRDYSGNGYIREKLSSLKGHFASLAELDDGNQHDLHQHYQWILGDLTRLRGKMAFDIDNGS